jgi:hypothetical protein
MRKEKWLGFFWICHKESLSICKPYSHQGTYAKDLDACAFFMRMRIILKFGTVHA